MKKSLEVGYKQHPISGLMKKIVMKLDEDIFGSAPIFPIYVEKYVESTMYVRWIHQSKQHLYFRTN